MVFVQNVKKEYFKKWNNEWIRNIFNNKKTEVRWIWESKAFLNSLELIYCCKFPNNLVTNLKGGLSNMAGSGVQGLVALAVSGVIGIYIVLQFTPLMENAGAVVVVLTGLFAILIAYAVIRVFL